MKYIKSLFISILFGVSLLLADPAMADWVGYCAANCDTGDSELQTCCQYFCAENLGACTGECPLQQCDACPPEDPECY
uniref:Uncharacterized protein n=1 Tax=Candidatus Kentrum sp. LPFa TaxID=2126335 RepID=A0A450X2U5_9GAMM|nr:MAG: hypothetical protein BECKLPF1236A_GA0070988_103842 [Candidatus Kentron sp. LPFa]VFK35465.1 MAG: hypothetical protein BECKLPF1236C_GA0070990_103782 [Candidatus Kentron sp. LPFa]